MQKVRYQFADFGPQTIYYFGLLAYATHVKGVWCWGLELNFDRLSCGLLYFLRPWLFTYGKGRGTGKLRAIKLRIGKPLLTLYLSKEHKQSSIEAIRQWRT